MILDDRPLVEIKKTTILIFLLLVPVSFQAQDRKVEKIFNECYFNSMPNKGHDLKVFYKAYESLLVSNEILNDTSGKSYYALFKKVIKSETVDTKTNFSLIDSINTLSYTALIHSNQKCTDNIKSLDIYKDSNTYRLERKIDSLNEAPNDQSSLADLLISSLNEKDFDLDYYKIRTLLIMDRRNSFPDIMVGKVYDEKRLETAFRVYLNKNSEIVFQGTNVSIDQLKLLVANYLRIARTNSLFIVDTYPDVKYSDYLKFINLIKSTFHKFKNELSEKKFNKPFEALTEIEKEIIESGYSFEIEETISDSP